MDDQESCKFSQKEKGGICKIEKLPQTEPLRNIKQTRKNTSGHFEGPKEVMKWHLCRIKENRKAFYIH